MNQKAQRKIIHVDMDAFFASIEQRDNPEWRGKPLAVGHGMERGVVAAASYEARKFGVRSAMASVSALQRCPHLIFTEPRFDVYKEVSRQIREIFLDYTDLVEPLSLDEAFLDVTTNKKNLLSATHIAMEIKKRIRDETNLTASAGVSINKFLAKVASDINKPDGICVIPPNKAQEFIDNLDIEKFFGVGKVTAKKMHDLGIFKGSDLKGKDKSFLAINFGKAGRYFYEITRLEDNRPVNPSRIRKSVGAERTFEKDVTENFEIVTRLYHIEQELFSRLEKSKYRGRTLTLKVKFHDFDQITRSKTLNREIDSFAILHKTSKELLSNLDFSTSKIRLLGLTVSNQHEVEEGEALQLTLDF